VCMVVDEVSQQKINQLALSVLVIVSRHAPKMTVIILIDSLVQSHKRWVYPRGDVRSFDCQ